MVLQPSGCVFGQQQPLMVQSQLESLQLPASMATTTAADLYP